MRITYFFEGISMSKFERLFLKGDGRIINAFREDFAKVVGHEKKENGRHKVFCRFAIICNLWRETYGLV